MRKRSAVMVLAKEFPQMEIQKKRSVDRKRLRSGLTVCAGVALLSGGLAFAQMSPGGGAAQQQQQSNPSAVSPGNNPGMQNSQMQQQGGNVMQDKDFVHSALQGGMAEVQLGQLAAEKGSSDDVKQFGQHMVADHTRLGEEMKQVAQQLGVQDPKDVSKKDKELMAKLQGLSGQQFDDAYIKAMVKDHKKDNDDFQAEASQTQNPALKQVAQQGGQVIQQHLQMIEQIAKNHNLMNDKGKLNSGQ
jgi:putative membrane protein